MIRNTIVHSERGCGSYTVSQYFNTKTGEVITPIDDLDLPCFLGYYSGSGKSWNRKANWSYDTDEYIKVGYIADGSVSGYGYGGRRHAYISKVKQVGNCSLFASVIEGDSRLFIVASFEAINNTIEQYIMYGSTYFLQELLSCSTEKDIIELLKLLMEEHNRFQWSEKTLVCGEFSLQAKYITENGISLQDVCRLAIRPSLTIDGKKYTIIGNYNPETHAIEHKPTFLRHNGLTYLESGKFIRAIRDPETLNQVEKYLYLLKKAEELIEKGLPEIKQYIAENWESAEWPVKEIQTSGLNFWVHVGHHEMWKTPTFPSVRVSIFTSMENIDDIHAMAGMPQYTRIKENLCQKFHNPQGKYNFQIMEDGIDLVGLMKYGGYDYHGAERPCDLRILFKKGENFGAAEAEMENKIIQILTRRTKLGLKYKVQRDFEIKRAQREKIIPLKKVPQILLVTREDSIKAGNCPYGTDKWIEENYPGQQSVAWGEIVKLFGTNSNLDRMLLSIAQQY